MTARGQTTIPKSLREAANLREGDVLAFELKGDYLTLRKVAPGRADYLHGLSRTLDEWASPEDEAAWRDL